MAENPDRPHIDHQEADTAVNAGSVGSLSIVYETARRPAPHMVAEKPYLFVGRERLQSDVVNALDLQGDNPGPVVLVGMGGAGKSTLCVTLAGLPEVAQALEGGVLLAMLGPEPDLMTWLAVWGKQLGEDLTDLPSLQARSRSLATRLFDKKILLVVDDVWNVEHALPFLVGGEGCRAIVTTRDSEVAHALALNPARVIQVKALNDDSAYELLYKLAPQAVAANPAGVQRLIARLGGLPLALTLAGRNLSEEWGAGLGVDDLLTELQNRDERMKLGAVNQPGMPGGKVTLGAVLGASYDRLPGDDHRHAFRCLAVFGGRPNSFTLDALEAVWGLERRPAQKILLALLNRSLVEKADGARYALHALLADFAASLLTTEEEELLHLRHARFYLEVARGYKEKELDQWQLLDADWENIRLAASWTARQVNSENAGVAILEMSADFAERLERLIRTRKPDGGLEWLKSGASACRRLGRSVEEAWLSLSMGDVLLDLGKMDEAIQANQRSLELFENANELKGARYARGNLGTIHRVRGEYAQAFVEYRQVTEPLEEAGDSFGAAVGNYNLGDVSLALGRLEDASHFLESSLASFRAILDSEDRLAVVLARLAELRIEMDMLDEAQKLAEEAVQMAGRAGATAALSAMPYRSLGKLWGKRNDAEKAEKCFLESIRLSEQAHMQEELAEALEAFGSYLAATGKTGQARERLAAAMGIYRGMGAASRVSRVQVQLVQMPP